MFVNGYYEVGDTVTLNSGGPVMTIMGFSPRGKAWCEWEIPGTKRYGRMAEVQGTEDGSPVIEEASFSLTCLTQNWPLKPAPGIYWVQRPDDPEPWLVRVALEEDKMLGVLEVIRMRRMVPSVVDMGECEIIPPSKRRYSPKYFPSDTQWWPVVKPEGRRTAEPVTVDGRPVAPADNVTG